MDHNPPSVSVVPLFRLFTLRHWRQTPKQSFLLLIILALGIAVYFSIRLANQAAVSSFQNFTDMVTQQSDWIISAPAGPLPENLLPELSAQLANHAVQIVPLVETTGTRPRDPKTKDERIGSRRTFQLLGLDLIAVQNLHHDQAPDRSWFRQINERNSDSKRGLLWDILEDPRSVFISQVLATQGNLTLGDELPLVIHDRVVRLKVAGIIPEIKGTPSAPATLLIMDLPALQSWAAKIGSIDRIEFIAEPGPDLRDRRARLGESLRALGAERWIVSTPSDRRNSAATMTQAFRLNLTILSLIALLVGLYLVFQALDGAVVRRREEIGILRSLGVEEGTIRRAWLMEAAVLGLAGGSAGLLLGWIGAQFSVRLVGQTVNALYYATSVDAAHLSPGESIVAIAIAVGASVLAGWIPAREAARTPPAQILARHALQPTGHPLWKKEWLGGLLLVVGWTLTWLPPLHLEGNMRLPWAGYLAALLWIVGGGILGGALLRCLAQVLHRLRNPGLSLRLATSQLVNPSSRHRWAVAGLICALSMTAGMVILVASFDDTMRGWINRTFQADLYISSDGAQSASTQNRIRPTTWQPIQNHPAVAAVNLMQATDIQLPDGQTMLVGSNLDFMRQHTEMAWVQAPQSDHIYDRSKNSSLALVSESFTEKFSKHRDDLLEITTPSGKRSVRIAGVFSDYGNERGSIVVDQEHYARWFKNELLSNLMIILKPGFEPESARSELLERHPGLSIYSNQHLRTEILRIFRQTFSITYALELIGVAVAVIGLGLTLASVLIERRNELTILRALGFEKNQIARATAWEGGLVSLSGIITGLLVSLLLGWLLIHVINKQSFGWTLQFSLPWGQLGLLALLTVVVGTGVAYGVGRWGADLPADRDE